MIDGGGIVRRWCVCPFFSGYDPAIIKGQRKAPFKVQGQHPVGQLFHGLGLLLAISNLLDLKKQGDSRESTNKQTHRLFHPIMLS